MWQLDRAAEKRVLKTLLEYRKTQSAEIFSWKFQDMQEQNLRQFPLKVDGTFSPRNRVFFTHRIRQGRVGSDVVEPLILSDGSGAVLVNRGWIEQSILDGSSNPKMNHLGHLTFTGRIQVLRGKTQSFSTQNLEGSWPLKLRSVNLNDLVDKLSDRLGIRIFPHLMRIDPDQPGAFGANWPEFNVRVAGHIGYALQWFTMALATIVIFILRSTNLYQLLKTTKK